MRAFIFVTELIAEGFVPGRQPLALMPLVDRPVVQQQVETLVEQGITQITILASAGVDRLRALFGDGARWGCSLSIQPLGQEAPLACLTQLPNTDELVLICLAERLLTTIQPLDVPFLAVTDTGLWSGLLLAPAHSLRRLPERLQPCHLGAFLLGPLAEVSREITWVNSLRALLHAQNLELGRRLHGESHIARSARVHPRARLLGPAWIGPQCRIGAGVVLGPNVCLGAGCIVERGTHISNALITPGSYIGAELEINHAIVDHSRLVNLHQEIGLTIEDSFLLGSVMKQRQALAVN